MVKKNKSGEAVIEEILKELKIKYDRRKKLVLRKDTKNYRIPDFYLQKYNLAIEYFGSWNNSKNKAMEMRERKRFMEKVGAYESSSINCVYLYPDELIHAKKIIKRKIDEIENPSEEDVIAQSVVIKPKKTTIKKMVKEEKIIFPEKKHKIKGLEENEIITKKEFHHEEAEGVKKFLLYNVYAIGLLFLSMLLISFGLFLIGNPLDNPLNQIYEVAYVLFILSGISSIILSTIFAINKNLSKGFVIVGVILLAFYLITLFSFGDPFTRIIIILVTALAIAPSEYYMVTSN
jgi:Fe2+ transport system protein B